MGTVSVHLASKVNRLMKPNCLHVKKTAAINPPKIIGSDWLPIVKVYMDRVRTDVSVKALFQIYGKRDEMVTIII